MNMKICRLHNFIFVALAYEANLRRWALEIHHANGNPSDESHPLVTALYPRLSFSDRQRLM